MEIDKASRIAAENIRKEGLTDIFPRPRELELLRNPDFCKIVVQVVAKSIRGGSLESLGIGPIDHVLLPKTGAFDFRRCALIQPLDTIKYLALVLTIADEIEKRRPIAAKHVVYSYRLNPKNGNIFDARYSYNSFKEKVKKNSLLKSSNFLVACDIANFYDRLNLHRLEATLLSIGIDSTRVTLLNELLLFWANRDSYGLPVGSNASRILAEAALLEVDDYMLSIGSKFIRFVDDYRFFAPDVHSAHHWLTQLIQRLWLEGLTINKAKTKIEDISSLRGESKQALKKIDVKRKAFYYKKASEGKEHLKDGGTVIRIIAGYGGVIPTRFRAPSKREIVKLRKSDVQAKLSGIKLKKLPTPEDITDLIKTIVSMKRYDLMIETPALADLFPQFTPYIVDVLEKHKDKIRQEDRIKIKNKIILTLKNTRHLPEYIALSLVRLLGLPDYLDKGTLLAQFRGLKRNAGAYIGRALLDSLGDHVSRGEALEIRTYFPRADAWEKRQIVYIVDRHLPDNEKRAWLKNVRSLEAQDLFIIEKIKPTNKKQGKKRRSKKVNKKNNSNNI